MMKLYVQRIENWKYYANIKIAIKTHKWNMQVCIYFDLRSTNRAELSSLKYLILLSWNKHS